MSQSRPRHRSALLAAAVIAGAPLLLPAAAYADPEASGRSVTFSGGGLLGVSCAANPSTGSVTIAAETTLRVVNRTGHRATLLLDGSARGEVAAGRAAQVLFHRGPVALALKPHCVIAEEKSVRVQVITVRPRPTSSDSVSGGSSPVPAPTGGGRDDADPSTPDEASGGSSGGRSPDGGAVLGRAPARGGADSGRPRGGHGDAVTHGAVPTVAAEPPAAAPGAPGAPGADSPAPGLVPGEVPDAGGGGTVPDLAAEPLASVEPVTEDGPIGLLAIIATVCVLGVSVGAIRAILAERASRAGVAVN